MATMPDLDAFKMADEVKPHIGFRVIVSGGDEWRRNTLRSRHPQADATSLTLQHHLAWTKRTHSPFVSLFAFWPRAVKWAKDRARRGGLDIDIAAVWINDQDVYDAYEAATTLLPPPERLLDYYVSEVIIVDRGRPADFQLLAKWKWVTERQWERVTFDWPTGYFSTSLPIGPLTFEPHNDEEIVENRKAILWENQGLEALADEVCDRAGPGNSSKIVILARLLCKEPTGQGIAFAGLMNMAERLRTR